MGKGARWQITEAICLRTGSWSRREYREDILGGSRVERSMFQLVVFMDMVAYLQASSGHRIEIFAQEYSYTPLDWVLVESLGVTVVRKPFLRGSSRTLSPRPCEAPDAVNRMRQSSFVREISIGTDCAYVQTLIDVKPTLVVASLSNNSENVRRWEMAVRLSISSSQFLIAVLLTNASVSYEKPRPLT